MNSQVPILYVVSDSVGETAEAVARAAASQFNGGHMVLRRVSHVHELSILDETVNRAHEENAIIAFTIVLPELKAHLLHVANQLGVMTVDIMGPMIDALESAVGHPPHLKAGLVHQLDEDYFRRIEAIEFAVKYDDGRDPRGLARADVILVGISRTSKTPLSMYLAHKQIRVANVPLVPEIAPPDELFELAGNHKIVGLTIRPDKLNLIRQERLRALGLTAQANYASYERILVELDFSDSVMKRLSCPVIDVSDKAVEETAGIILEHVSGKGQPK
jgi:[pyruvate, water dikinase]-phosphate phosphotransferase / [pyruvate, water dikinase] kinase